MLSSHQRQHRAPSLFHSNCSPQRDPSLQSRALCTALFWFSSVHSPHVSIVRCPTFPYLFATVVITQSQLISMYNSESLLYTLSPYPGNPSSQNYQGSLCMHKHTKHQKVLGFELVHTSYCSPSGSLSPGDLQSSEYPERDMKISLGEKMTWNEFSIALPPLPIERDEANTPVFEPEH